MSYHSDTLTQKWPQLTLAEQLGNVGSEVSRMINWRYKDKNIADKAFERMLELIDLTLATVRGKYRIREIARSRELLVSNWLESNKSTDADLAGLNRYFSQFALLAHR